MAELTQWATFYSILGSAAATLIGLQFIVMTLVAERPRVRATPETGAAFATPTIVHFASVLLLAALLRIPWQSIASVAIAWGIFGFCGVAYAVSVIRGMNKQTKYQPVFEDWLCHAVLPLVAYAALAASAFTARRHPHGSLLAVGGAGLALLLTGIHNAWDAIAWHVFSGPPATPEPNGPPAEKKAP